MIDAILNHLLWVVIGTIILMVLGRLFINLPAWRLGLRKAIKQYSLMYHLSGYYMFRTDDDPNIYIISDGIWGINATHLVFAHRSTLDALDRTIEIAKVCSLEIFHYDVSECIFIENRNADVIVHGIDNAPKLRNRGRLEHKIEDAIVDAAKKPMAASTLAMHKNENVCRITCVDGTESFFYYKYTSRNAEIIDEIRRYVSTK